MLKSNKQELGIGQNLENFTTNGYIVYGIDFSTATYVV